MGSECGLPRGWPMTWVTSDRDNTLSPCVERRVLSARKMAAPPVLAAVLEQLAAPARTWKLGNSFDVIFGPVPNQF